MAETNRPERQALHSHNRWSLDGASVHTFFTKGHSFFVYDPTIKAVTRDRTLEDALIAMVNVREDAFARHQPVAEVADAATLH
jgi:hypothetical protein